MKRDLLDSERALWKALPRGRKNARGARDLAADLGIDPGRTCVRVRTLARSLNFKGYPVCAAVETPGGFFKPASDQQIEDYCAVLEGKIEPLKRRSAALRAAKKRKS